MVGVPSSLITKFRAALRSANALFKDAVDSRVRELKELLKIDPREEIPEEAETLVDDMVVYFRQTGEAIKGKAYQVTSVFVPQMQKRVDHFIALALKRKGIPPEAVGYVPNDPKLVKLLEGFTIASIKGLTETGIRRLENDIREIVIRGGTYREVEQSIKVAFKFLDSKANQIAITECNKIWSRLALQRMLAFGIEEWTWRTTGDGFVCKYCKPLDRKVFKTGEVISVTMGVNKKRTTKVKHPPLHVGCRCAMILKAPKKKK